MQGAIFWWKINPSEKTKETEGDTEQHPHRLSPLVFDDLASCHSDVSDSEHLLFVRGGALWDRWERGVVRHCWGRGHLEQGLSESDCRHGGAGRYWLCGAGGQVVTDCAGLSWAL